MWLLYHQGRVWFAVWPTGMVKKDANFDLVIKRTQLVSAYLLISQDSTIALKTPKSYVPISFPLPCSISVKRLSYKLCSTVWLVGWFQKAGVRMSGDFQYCFLYLWIAICWISRWGWDGDFKLINFGYSQTSIISPFWGKGWGWYFRGGGFEKYDNVLNCDQTILTKKCKDKDNDKDVSDSRDWQALQT